MYEKVTLKQGELSCAVIDFRFPLKGGGMYTVP